MSWLKNNVLFVTGTDTGVGKTVISSAVIRYYTSIGKKVAPFKPVASGSFQTKDGLRNDDALQLLAASGGEFLYDQVNPYVFEEPIAPHIAAAKTNTDIRIEHITQQVKKFSEESDVVVIEGAGGWQVPITNETSFADWVRVLQCPVILVVGLRVGCINHAVLSYLDIVKGPNKVIGWVANTMDKQVEYIPEIVEYLAQTIDAPLLGTVPYLTHNKRAETYIDFLLLSEL